MTHDASSPERLRPDRFRILRPIGSGGMGVVYEALDRRTNRPVAIKELPTLVADRLYRFKQEFRTLKDVHHPNLVSLYELYEDGGRWFYTMELVAGNDFVSAVRGQPAPGGSPGEATFAGAPPRLLRTDATQVPAYLQAGALERLRGATLQLTCGLEAIHRAGKLHRDIKPSNVLIDRSARVVILDFGLATELAGEHAASFVGTPSYIAPEVIDGVRCAANDWYSVGVMLFVAATGRTPFHDDASWVRSLMARLARPAPAPSEFAPQTPKWLDRLCLGLLDANPETRWNATHIRNLLTPSTSQELIVGPHTGSFEIHTHPETGPVRVRSVAERAQFVGRQSELGSLGELLSGGSGARVAWVHGPDGLGKSRLLERFTDGHRTAPGAILTTRVNPEEHVPFKALDGIIDALSRHIDEQFRLDDTVFDERLAASRLFPVLNPETSAPRLNPVVGDGAEARRAGFAAVRSLMARVARRLPVAVIIDDWHLADRDSRDLMTFVLTGANPPPLLLVLASTQAPDVGTFGRRLMGAHSVAFLGLELGPLDPQESGELATLLSRGHQTPDAMAAYIAAESGGVPWVIEELVVGLDSSDSNQPTPESSLEDVIGRRIARLPLTTRRLLETVAVAQPIASTLAMSISQSRRAELRALCSELLLRVDSDGETVSTYHPRVREICLGSVGPDTAVGVHLAAAESLIAGPNAAPDQVARHLELAGEDLRAAQYLLACAEKAERQLAFEFAATLCERAVARTPDNDGRRAHRMRQWGTALIRAGSGVRGARVLIAAAAGLPESDRHEVLVDAAVQLVAGGAPDEGLTIAKAALGRFSYRVPSRGTSLAHLTWGRARMRFLRPPAPGEVTVAAPQTRARLDALWRLGTTLSVLDVPTGAALATAHNEAAFREGGPLEVSRALSMEGILTGILEPVRGAEMLQRALEVAQGLKDGYAQSLAEFGLAVLSFNAGDLGGALTAASTAEARLRRHAPASTWEIHNCQALQLQLLYYLGRVDQLANESERLLHGADLHENLYSQACFQSGWAVQPLLASDRPARAHEMLDASDVAVSGQSYVFQALFKVIGRTSLAIYEDDGPLAHSIITGAWKSLERTRVIAWPFLRDAMLELRGRAALSAALGSGDHRLLGAARGEASRLLTQGRDPWRRALAGFLRAGALLAQGEDENACAELLRAEQAADDARMKTHVFVARWVRGKMSLDAELQQASWQALRNLGVASPAQYARLLLPWG
jgi:eukaryotic-like serine/threonine-protein kinase